MLLSLHIASVLAVVDSLRAHGQRAARLGAGVDGAEEAYTFDEFVRDFGREYVAGSEEYERRGAIFLDSLSKISAKNARIERSWTAGVYPFMDWTAAERLERLHGYAPSASRRHRAAEADAPLAALQTSRTSGKDVTAGQVYGGAGDSFEADGPAVQDQNRFGTCGSCWAFASVAAVEARLMKMSSPSLPPGEPQLSVQALLECVPRQPSCGGGCQGSSPELAFDYMRDHGVPLEANLPYDPREVGQCPLKTYPADWVRVTLSGWRALPSNDAQAFMKALVEDGPVVLTADSSSWYEYQSGIFDDCPKDATPNHSVLARGYGSENGKKYWQVQNSWGTQWGEEGNIRLKRHDDLHSWCGVDRAKDGAGTGCDGTKHANVTVCGTCGLLGYDPMVPEVGFVMLGPGPGGADFGSAAPEAVPEAWRDRLAPGHRIKASDFDHSPPAPPTPPRRAVSEATTTDAPAAGEAKVDGPGQADDFQRATAEELLAQHSAVASASEATTAQPLDPNPPSDPGYADPFDARAGAAEEGVTAETLTRAPPSDDSTASVLPAELEEDEDDGGFSGASLAGYLRR